MTEPSRPVGLPPLSSVLPSLYIGTATFNNSYVEDPAHMPYREIVRRALVDFGVRGFDTSAYYGPAEDLLGEALEASGVDRDAYFLQTKAGRVHINGFDYAPASIKASVARSLQRLRTDHVDLVFAHDVEFVRPDEVVAAVRALRELRSTGTLRYVGISGFPVEVLVELAELVLRETGEPLDAVLSYGHCTVQNETLVTGSGEAKETKTSAETPLARFHRAGVSVVLNASLLNMGLLTTRGVDNGPQAAWHPSPPALRDVCADAARLCFKGPDSLGSLERVSLRYALDTWARAAAAAGLGTTTAPVPAPGVPHSAVILSEKTPATVGASVLGVTSVEELAETMLEWWSVLDGLGIPHVGSVSGGKLVVTPLDGEATPPSDVDGPAAAAAAALDQRKEGLRRMQEVQAFVHHKIWPVLGQWRDYAWASPTEGWVNELTPSAKEQSSQ